jgi:sialic acid synthase SpsE
MSNLKAATSAIFGTVSDTAQAASALVTSAASGAHMINDFVTTARIKQQTTLKISLETHTQYAVDDAARESLRRDMELQEFLGGDQAKIESYTLHHARFAALFADKN